MSAHHTSLIVYRPGVDRTYLLFYVDDIVSTASSTGPHFGVLLLPFSGSSHEGFGCSSSFSKDAHLAWLWSLSLSMVDMIEIHEHADMADCKLCSMLDALQYLAEGAPNLQNFTI